MGFLTNALYAKNVFILISGLFFSTVCFSNPAWQSLAPGIAYRTLHKKQSPSWSQIHVFRINLKNNSFQSIFAASFSKKLASVEEFATHAGVPLAINGGFFDSQYRPLGLRISQYKQKNPIKSISWWGIFYIKNNKAYITTPDGFKANSHIAFAVQSGPRLIVNGSIMPLKPGLAERTALGITRQGQIIILVTENAKMTATELATLMQSKPLSCVQALNLDGGSSTQLFANFYNFQHRVYGYSHVSDAIVLSPAK